MKNNLQSINPLPIIKRYIGKYRQHTVFVSVLIVLLIYMFVVLKINSLANASPSPEQTQTVTSSVPKIDTKTIDQIQSLENNNADIHSLFDQARNNPFQE